MRTIKILGLFICIALVFSVSFAQPVNAASAEEEVLQVITNYVKAVNDNNAELCSSLHYQSPITTTFEPWGRFLKQGGVTIPGPGSSLELNHPHATMLGDNAAFMTAYFTVTKSVPQGMSATPGVSAAPEASAPPAMSAASEMSAPPEMNAEYYRGTLVLQKIGDKWLIVHEHYSTQP